MRSPSVPLDFENGLSSPDPLASSSLSECSNRSTSKRTQSSATRKSHANAASIETQSRLPPSSPSRTITEQTLSPWRIRVTVEAEPETDMSGLVQTLTKTVKVPLRDESSPAPEKGQRSVRRRPRSRTGSPAKDRQRSITPAGGRQRRQSVTDLDIVVLGDDAEEDEWTPKARRASPAKSRSQKPSSRKGRRKSEPSVSAFDVRQDTDIEDEAQAADTAVEEDSLELRQIDLNNISIRPRANSVKQKGKAVLDFKNVGENTLPAPRHDPPTAATRRVSNNSVMSYPTPSPTVSERGDSDEVEKPACEHAEGFDTIMESEGFTMIDLDSIPSVRQILSSPPDVQAPASVAQLSPIAEAESTMQSDSSSPAHRERPQSVASAVPAHLNGMEGISEISSTMPSSPPVSQPRLKPVPPKSTVSHLLPPVSASQPRNRLVTPHTLSSPQLPSPPRPVSHKERSTPDSAKVMKAGLVLQGAVEPVHSQPSLQSRKQDTPNDAVHVRSSSDELFEGFDSGTKRELRAGLRFGEELAKRQQPHPLPVQSQVGQHINSGSVHVWRIESVASRTPSKMQFGTTTELNEGQKQNLSGRGSPFAASSVSPTPGQFSNTRIRQERQWQLEREAVSQQIEEAGPDNIVIVSSDDGTSQSESEHEDQNEAMEDVTMQDDDDIWLEEAKDSSSSPRQSEYSEHLSQENPNKTTEQPRRSLLPSSWTREHRATTNEDSTLLTNGEEVSGMFWKQPDEQDGFRFGDAAITNVRKELRKSGEASFATRRSSGTFDIEKMLGTPKRIRDSLDKEQQSGSSGVVGSSSSLSLNAPLDMDNAIDGEESEDSHISAYGAEPDASSPAHPETVPVDFNDQKLGEYRTMTLPLNRARAAPSPSATRPPTPRSAMKGSRQSFGALNGQGVFFGESDQGARKVVFAERSKGVNIDWIESSSSIIGATDEASSPIVEHQRHHEIRQQIQSSPQVDVSPKTSAPYTSGTHTPNTHTEGEDHVVPKPQTGWFGWLKPAKASEPGLERKTSSDISPMDGAVDSSHQPAATQQDLDETWAPTSRNAVPQAQISNQSSHGRPRSAQIPSYLLPPSYPSDPKRAPSMSLPTSGHFTNTHFRTLHIIHAKSQRPRFHSPKFVECRPDIRQLAIGGYKVEIDESEADMGGFVWTFGELEARVLERFCREIEFGILTKGMSEDEVRRHAGQWMNGGSDVVAPGIWSGKVSHGAGEVPWEWSLTQLATWLGRIVVGEVVRKEEYRS